LYKAEAKNQETLARYGHGTPNDWLENNVYLRFPWQGVGVTLVLDFILFGFRWGNFAATLIVRQTLLCR